MAQELTLKEKTLNLKNRLKEQEATFQRLLPPTIRMDADRFALMAWRAITLNPKLVQCDPNTVLGALLDAARFGLTIDGVSGKAALVPFKGKAQLIIGYKGLIELMIRSGKVVAVDAEVVRENDVFEYQLGTEARLKHVPAPKERGEITHAYCILHLANGAKTFRVLSHEQLEDIRNKSPFGHDERGPWCTHTEEMYRKTAVRATAKTAPMSDELGRAVAQDELIESGIDQRLEVNLEEPEERSGEEE